MSAPPVVTALEAGLVYVNDHMPGIRRRKAGRGFFYQNPDGSRVTESATLERIRKLAIPPAYDNVWICPLENGHLQATGVDARGRKQYRYHARFREVRDEAKYSRMAEFGEALPRIRERIDADLATRGLTRQKVLATIVYLLEKSLIRVGNEEYAKENKSYGLTTMRNRHVQVQGANIRFKFLGKSKIQHEIEIHDRRLARVIKNLQDLPGQDLFQYVDEDGAKHSITSSDVNAYLKEITGKDFTAKDFRTWAGTVLALTELAAMDIPETKRAQKQAVTGVMKVVARQLGNTPAISRKCYVHPAVLNAYEAGSLREFLKDEPEANPEGVMQLVECAEQAVIDLLQHHATEVAQVIKRPEAYAG